MAVVRLNMPMIDARIARIRSRWRQHISQAVVYSILVLFGLFSMLPLFFMVSGSLMTGNEIFSLMPHFLPERPVFENYRELFARTNFLLYLRNSIIISVAQTVGVLFFASLAGYVFAKRRFPGRNGLFLVALTSTLLPNGQMTMIPFYLLMVQLPWVNTFWPLIVPWWAPALSIFLMRQYIATGIPDELLEAARIDGCSMWRSYWRIVLPLSKPGLIVVGMMQFVSIWNDFLFGLLVLKRDELRTVTVALIELSTRTQQATLYGPLFAGIVLATLPPVVIYLIFQRRLTQGILSGALRG